MAVARGLLPVAFLLLTASTYGSALWAERPWFGFTVDWLTIMMQIEFLVIHSFAFIMVIACLKPKRPFLKFMRWVAFAAFAALYVFAAWESKGGWASVGAFLGLTAVTYLGAMLHRIWIGELVLLGVRWMVNSFAFLFLADKTGTPDVVNDWVGQPSVLEFGFWYFAVLVIFEGMISWGRWFLTRTQKEGDAVDPKSELKDMQEKAQ